MMNVMFEQAEEIRKDHPVTAEDMSNIIVNYLAQTGLDEKSTENSEEALFTDVQRYGKDYDGELLDDLIPLKCVSAVYLGYRMEPEKKKHIVEISQNKNRSGANISAYEAILSCDTYEFDFVKLI